MLDSLRSLYVFAQVAETTSFSRAADRLGMTRSAVSKHVAQLEAELGVQLMVRTTRRVVLTEVGERVQASCLRLVEQVEAAHEAALGEGAALSGPLRITAPTALGRSHLVPLVVEFMRLHPAISVELVLGDSFVDLVEERIDVALRVGGRTEQSFVSRRVASVAFFLVASPEYVARHGMPRSPAALAEHAFILHTPSGARPRLTLAKGRRRETVRVDGRFACDDGPANLRAAKAGLGLILVPDFEVASDLEQGDLVRVLPSWKFDDAALHLVFPPRTHVLGRVRAFADFVVERFRVPPWRVRV